MTVRQVRPAIIIALAAVAATCAGAESIALPAGDGATLTIDGSTGRVLGLERGGARLAASGGFRVEDVASGEVAELRGAAVRRGDVVHWSGAAPGMGLELEADLRPGTAALEIAGTLQDTTGRDRAAQLIFALGFDAVGWTWWQDMRRAQVIEAGGTYSDHFWHSTYPLCCVCTDEIAVSLAIPLDRCVTHRLVYDAAAGELRLELKLGLSPMTAKFPSQAHFGLFVFCPHPKWGFRAAADQYYRAHPGPFTTHASTRGLWMTFHDLAEIPLAEDFQFGFHESGSNPAANRRLVVATLKYVIPGQTDVLLPFDARRGMSFDEVEDMVRTDQQYERAREVLLDRLQVMRDSVMFDAEGRPRVKEFYANWARGRLIYDCMVNSDPDLQVEHPYARTMDAVWQKADAELEAEGFDLEGVYLDNFGGSATDHRREHWARVDHPLTYDRDNLRPCTHTGIAEHEYAEHLGRIHWPQGHIVFANGWTRPHLFHTAVLDAGGTETFWATRQRRLGSRFDWARVLMQGKVHCPLLKFDKAEFNALFSHLEDWLAECTHYSFYPSIYTSGGWKYQSFWVDPAMYERYREQYRLYLPVVEALDRAGWQPVTRASLSDPLLGIERFGEPRDGEFFLTLYNPLADAAGTDVTCELTCPGEDVVAMDLLHPEVWFALPDGKADLTTTVRSLECRALLVAPRERAIEWLWGRARQALELVPPEEGDPLAAGLAGLRAAMAACAPEDTAALAALAAKLRDLALRNASYHEPGPERYLTLRARECWRYLSAALALRHGLRTDLLPLDARIAAGEPVPAVSADERLGEVEVRLLDVPAGGQSWSTRPRERISVAAVADAMLGGEAVPVCVQSSYVTEWPVQLVPSADGNGTVRVAAANLTHRALQLSIEGRAGAGFTIIPARSELSLPRGDMQTIEARLSGSADEAGAVSINWVATTVGGELVGWATSTVALTPAASNMLAQGDFEGWDQPPANTTLQGTAQVVSEGARAGEGCLLVEAQDEEGTHACQWQMTLDGPPPAQMVVRGWSRAERVSGERDKDYSVWVGGRTTSDGWAHIGTAQFDTGSHDWQQVTETFTVPPDVNRINVWAIFRGHSGKAWFDDIYVAPAAAAHGHNLARAAAVRVDGAPAYDTEGSPAGHALELRWEAPVEVSKVLLHWPKGQRRPLSSTEFAIQYHDGADWAYWALGHVYVPEQVSELVAPPVVTDRLRLVQAPRGGAIDARNELHLTEIEVM